MQAAWQGGEYTDDLRIQVERALRGAFMERAREDSGPTRTLHLATLRQLRNSGLRHLVLKEGKCSSMRSLFRRRAILEPIVILRFHPARRLLWQINWG